MRVVGLISGTSIDAIDAALVEIDRAETTLHVALHAFAMCPFDESLRNRVRQLLPPHAGSTVDVCEVNVLLGEAFAQAVQAVTQRAGLSMAQLDLIASHGQTIYHQVAPGSVRSTLQLGDPAVIAERCGCTVVSDFRPRDIAAGGEGAPLVPYLDQLLLADPTVSRAVQNIGGIGNVTYLPASEGDHKGSPLQAFDTGPGNVLIDEAVRLLTGGQATFDRDGRMAAAGTVDEELLREWLAHPFFSQPPPKSTGREAWGPGEAQRYVEQAHARGLSLNDTLATITALTARSIADAYRRYLRRIDEVLVGGGGARNPTLLAMLQAALLGIPVRTVDDVALDADAKEALAFAVLGYASLHGWPDNVPAATGARHPAVLGNITPGSNYRALLEQVIAAPPDPPRRIQLVSQVTTMNNQHLDSVQALATSITESVNPDTQNIDTLPTREVVAAIAAEDAKVAPAVAAQGEQIARLADVVVERMQRGGRLIYAGAGTSGRLGVLDAVECPPTFGVEPGLVVGLLAGGPPAFTKSIEAVEDNPDNGRQDIAALDVGPNDVVLGIAASGRTPYVLGAVAEARQRGAFVAGLACTHPSPLAASVDLMIAPVVGPEVVTGSTRMKAGTAQKLVLNTLSTTVMIKLGKTFGNLMVDLQPLNEKLRRRTAALVATATGLTSEEAQHLLQAAGGEPKTAIVMALAQVDAGQARQRLAASAGHVRRALEMRSDE